MTNREIEDAIQVICDDQRAQWAELEIDHLPHNKVDLRPPATQSQIIECEKFLGRDFSPSYRQFLLLHDGLRLGENWFLLGTKDYTSSIFRERFTWFNHDFLDLDKHPPFPEISDEVFAPENFYRLVDATGAVPAHLHELKAFIDNYAERITWTGEPDEGELFNACIPRHTPISFDEGNDSYAFFNVDMRQDDGELAVVLFYSDSDPTLYLTFYDYLCGNSL